MADRGGRQRRAYVRDGELRCRAAAPRPTTQWSSAPPPSWGLVWLGVALSLNRIVRIVGYGWVAFLHRRLGLRALTASAAFGAALSTVGYGLALGLVPLLIARLVWGFAYGVLNVLRIAGRPVVYPYRDFRRRSRIGYMLVDGACRA